MDRESNDWAKKKVAEWPPHRGAIKLADGYHRAEDESKRIRARGGRPIGRVGRCPEAGSAGRDRCLGSFRVRSRVQMLLDRRSRGQPRDVPRADGAGGRRGRAARRCSPSASRSSAAARATSSRSPSRSTAAARSSARCASSRPSTASGSSAAARPRWSPAIRSARTTPRSSSIRAASWSRATARSTCSTSTSRAARRCASRTRPRAGDELVVVDIAGAPVGLSICYDVRFPELYRAAGQGPRRRGAAGAGRVHRAHRRGALAPAPARARDRGPGVGRGGGAVGPAQREARELRPHAGRRSVGHDRRRARRGRRRRDGDARRRRRSRSGARRCRASSTRCSGSSGYRGALPAPGGALPAPGGALPAALPARSAALAFARSIAALISASVMSGRSCS